MLRLPVCPLLLILRSSIFDFGFWCLCFVHLHVAGRSRRHAITNIRVWEIFNSSGCISMWKILNLFRSDPKFFIVTQVSRILYCINHCLRITQHQLSKVVYWKFKRQSWYHSYSKFNRVFIPSRILKRAGGFLQELEMVFHMSQTM